MPEDTTYAGWRVVSVDASGGALLDGPGGDRRRVWFGEIERLRAELERLRDVVCDEDRASIARCLGEQEGEG